MYWVPYMAYANGSYWLSVLLMCVISMIVTFTWTFVQRTYFPEDYHIIQEQDIIKRKVTLPEETKPASQLFAPKPASAELRYSGFAYEPGDEASLSASVRKSAKQAAKSPPVSVGPHDPSLQRVPSAHHLTLEEENL